MTLTYESVTLNLPGTLGEEFTAKDGYAVVGGSIRFGRNRCDISAHIPTGIWDKPTIKNEYVKPLKEKVVEDLETIDDLLPTLQQLATEEKAPNTLMYSREPNTKEWFRVYDCTSTPPGRVFPTMLAIKNTELRLLRMEYRDLVPLSQSVNMQEGKLVYVEGDSLRDALQKAIAIYTLAERIRQI